MSDMKAERKGLVRELTISWKLLMQCRSVLNGRQVWPDTQEVHHSWSNESTKGSAMMLGAVLAMVVLLQP
jgi:hypothetical protein